MEQVTIEQALDRVLSLNGLKYTVSENAIVIAKDASAVKNLQSEQMKVQGTVRDEKGLPLPGASVYLKAENTLGVTTDIGGHFEFKPLINNETWSSGLNFTGTGGTTIDIYPTF